MPVRIPRRSADDDDNDPLAFVTAPPVNETPKEREERLQAEREAKTISDAIDSEITRQQLAEKKGPKAVKVLLLGQSESGKSTTLKNFQLMYEPKAFLKERASWRAIIQLNVVRSIHVIFEAMNRSVHQHNFYDQQNYPYPASSSSPSSSPPPERQRPNGRHRARSESPDLPYIEPELLKLKMRLAPLLRVEDTLMHRLSSTSGTTSAAIGAAGIGIGTARMPAKSVIREVAVNSTTPWKDVLTRALPGHRNSVHPENGDIDWDDPDDPGRVLFECKEDMKRLWAHPVVQELLEKQNVRLEEMAGFFLDCLDDVAGERYIPSDDHILRARLKTLGVSEHRVTMNPGGGIGSDWRIFDVGGHRSLRAAWVPYFDNMDAIIFLAPISAFDQVLAEAPKVNRLEDSVLIWTQIVSNQLLKDTELILFLNKCDILRGKLEAGIKFREYVVSYGGRPNDFESASNYLRKKFAGILKENSPVPRMFYCHLTSVIDTKSTRKVIANVKDMLMRSNLKSSTLLA